MQPEGLEDLPELTPCIEAAVAIVGVILRLVNHLLGVAMWSLCSAAVIDFISYLRGE